MSTPIATPRGTTTDPTRPHRTPRSSLQRIRSLFRAETIQLKRNKLMLFNAFVMPVLPFLLLIPMRINNKLDTTQTELFTSMAVVLALLFVVYYNVLSAVVSRRDELVLKRLRTGECSDKEILTAISLPSAGITIALVVVMTAVAWLALGQAPPVNVVLVAGAVIGGILLFVMLALLTTVVTRNSEAAQITSLPLVLLSVLGAGFSSTEWMPEWGQTLVRFTPMAPVSELFSLGWSGTHPAGGGVTQEFLGTFVHAWQPALVLLGWIVLSAVITATYFRWEPRH